MQIFLQDFLSILFWSCIEKPERNIAKFLNAQKVENPWKKSLNVSNAKKQIYFNTIQDGGPRMPPLLVFLL